MQRPSGTILEGLCVSRSGLCLKELFERFSGSFHNFSSAFCNADGDVSARFAGTLADISCSVHRVEGDQIHGAFSGALREGTGTLTDAFPDVGGAVATSAPAPRDFACFAEGASGGGWIGVPEGSDIWS